VSYSPGRVTSYTVRGHAHSIPHAPPDADTHTRLPTCYLSTFRPERGHNTLDVLLFVMVAFFQQLEPSILATTSVNDCVRLVKDAAFTAYDSASLVQVALLQRKRFAPRALATLRVVGRRSFGTSSTVTKGRVARVHAWGSFVASFEPAEPSVEALRSVLYMLRPSFKPAGYASSLFKAGSSFLGWSEPTAPTTPTTRRSDVTRVALDTTVTFDPQCQSWQPNSSSNDLLNEMSVGRFMECMDALADFYPSFEMSRAVMLVQVMPFYDFSFAGGQGQGAANTSTSAVGRVNAREMLLSFVLMCRNMPLYEKMDLMFDLLCDDVTLNSVSLGFYCTKFAALLYWHSAHTRQTDTPLSPHHTSPIAHPRTHTPTHHPHPEPHGGRFGLCVHNAAGDGTPLAQSPV